MQTTIFDILYPRFKIDKPIRLIEMFAGYGSQALALKYLGVKFEHWKICEWAVKSIQAYKDIHFQNESAILIGYNREREIQNLFKKGISSNYNEPMTLEQIKRLSDNQIYTITENILLTHNLVNIQQVKGKDLEITDTDKYCYVMTYSFPCQDLSLAGNGKGMSDTSTRSGMLWEVERILTECKELGSLPQVLLMENVPQVHGEGNIEDFNKWQLRLEELGYKNYWQDLIATDYGIPQTRNRCFMVSILGDYSYSFPPKQELKLRLKDMLEDEVDEKYYLSDAMIKYLTNENTKGYQRKQAFESVQKNIVENGIAGTITTNAGNRATDNFIITKHLKETLEQNKIENGISFIDGYNRTIKNDGMATTLSTKCPASADKYICIKNATKKGYLEATDGDGIDISSRMEYHRGTVQQGKTQTLSTMGGENNGVVVLGNYSPSGHNASRIVDKDYSSPTVMENHGTITATNTNDLRIRKLTPKECFRLQGVKDEDYEKVAKNQSNASLYHLAGDSIVVNVLMAIFKELL